MPKKTFSDTYTSLPDYWTDGLTETQINMTLSFFAPNCFTDGKVDFAKLKENINSPQSSNVFNTLFNIPYRATSRLDELVQEIAEKYGHNIIAHGVEEEKGGMYNLLQMCVSDKLRCPRDHWGRFIYGMPNTSPLAHGPYYLIHTIKAEHDTEMPNNPNFSDLAYVLVPFKKNKTILIEKLAEMQEKELVSQQAVDGFIKKLKTYNEFLIELKRQHSVKSMARVGLFKQPDESEDACSMSPRKRKKLFGA